MMRAALGRKALVRTSTGTLRKLLSQTRPAAGTNYAHFSSVLTAPTLQEDEVGDIQSFQNTRPQRAMKQINPNGRKMLNDELKSSVARINDKSEKATLSANKKHNPDVPNPPQEEKEKAGAETVTHSAPATHITYTGNATMPITSKLKIFTPKEDTPRGTWPLFRIMDENGELRDPSFDGYEHDPDLPDDTTHQSFVSGMACASNETKGDDPCALTSLRSKLQSKYPYHALEIERNHLLHASATIFPDTGSTNTLLRAHRQMVRLRQMDNILQNAQRQGRISFYMSCRGEEAMHIGSASALKLQDTVFAQYREAGVLMWRGFTLNQFANQCFSNAGDLGRGRQMPVHYGSRALNYHTISSPLGTQLPQAVGAAYKLKLGNRNRSNSQIKEEGSIAIVFFGDGGASTTDFHSACNFAATLKTPVIFFCRNNGYAISTPVTDQYAGDGIVSRAPGYGMAGIRVDGNDILAVSAAVRAARFYALRNSAPVMIEAMTYRQGHHSTSDDSTRYRSADEVHKFAEEHDPLKRMNQFLNLHGWMDKNAYSEIKDEERMDVLKAMGAAEKRPKPKLETLFQDVYHNLPPHIQRQEQELHAHLRKYPRHY